MIILVFTEGTILMHFLAKGCSRKGILEQIKQKIKSVYDYSSYIPTKDSVIKLQQWKKQGVRIYYLTSRKRTEQINAIQNVLQNNNFPDYKNLLYRKKREQYKDVAERLMPNIIIEDNCESIGGEPEMVYPNIKRGLKKRIKSIVVKEFKGLSFLPERLNELQDFLPIDDGRQR